MQIARFDFDTDFTDVMRMAKAMHAKSIFNVMRLNVQKLARFFIDSSEADNCFFWVARDKETIGMLIAFYQEHYFSDDCFSDDQMLWIEPDYRGSTAAEMLVERYKVWCADNNVVLPMISCATGINSDRTKAFYERCGSECIGYNFVLRI